MTIYITLCTLFNFHIFNTLYSRILRIHNNVVTTQTVEPSAVTIHGCAWHAVTYIHEHSRKRPAPPKRNSRGRHTFSPRRREGDNCLLSIRLTFFRSGHVSWREFKIFYPLQKKCSTPLKKFSLQKIFNLETNFELPRNYIKFNF